MWLIPLRLLTGAGAVGTVTPPPAVGLPDMSIANFYVVDYTSKRRRPLTEEEWALVRQWAKIYKRVKLRYIKDMTAHQALERRAEKQLRPKPEPAERKRESRRDRRAAKRLRRAARRADPSGLMPR